MKKLKLFLSLLVLFTFSVGTWAAVPDSPKWVATDLEDIPDSSMIIIISNSTTATNIALPSTEASGNPAKVACTVSTTDGVTTITPPDGKTLQNLAWTVRRLISNKNDTTYKFYQDGSTTVRLYLTGLSSNTAVRVGNASSDYDSFVMGTSGKLLEARNGANRGGRFVGPYDNSGSDWRSYNSETATNYKGAQLTFYVLKASSEPTV